MKAAAIVSTPRVEEGIRCAISRAHDRFAGRAGSESGVFVKVQAPSLSLSEAARSSGVSLRRFWVRVGPTRDSPSAFICSTAARKRERSFSKAAGLVPISKIDAMKFSSAEFSSRRRTR